MSITTKDNVDYVYAKMEKYFWSSRGIPNNRSLEINRQVFWIRNVLIIIHINGFALGPLLIKYQLYPHWFFLKNCPYLVHFCFLMLDICVVIGGCLICNVHMFTLLYFCLNLNIQTKIVAQYFDNMADDIKEIDAIERVGVITYNQHIFRNWILLGIKQHIRLSR